MYKFKYKDLADLQLAIKLNTKKRSQILDQIEKAVNTISTSDALVGETENIKYYYKYIYSYIICMLRYLLIKHNDDITEYLKLYEFKRMAGATEINEANLQELKELIYKTGLEIENNNARLSQIRNTVNDKVNAPQPNLIAITLQRKEMIDFINRTIKNIKENESEGSLRVTSLDLKINVTKSLINTRLKDNRPVTSYSDFPTSKDFEAYRIMLSNNIIEVLNDYYLVKEFEKKNPDIAKQLNKFLSSGKFNNLTDEEKNRIKAIAYTAKEPYRSIFLNDLKNLKLYTTKSPEDVSFFFHEETNGIYRFFMKDKGKIHLTEDHDFLTIFHESGHSLDFICDAYNMSGFDTHNFLYYDKNLKAHITLEDAIDYDIFYNKNNPNSITSILNGDYRTNRIITALKNGNIADLSEDDRKLATYTINTFKQNLPDGRSSHSVSDIYGGATKNLLQEGYGHDDDYWETSPENKSLELWAEYYGDNIMGNKASLNTTRSYFPTATKVMDAYTETLTERSTITINEPKAKPSINDSINEIYDSIPYHPLG